MKRTVEATVKTVVGQMLSIDPALIRPEQRLGEDLGADSLDLIEIVMAMEEEVRLEITDEAAEKFVTVDDIIKHLEPRLES